MWPGFDTKHFWTTIFFRDKSQMSKYTLKTWELEKGQKGKIIAVREHSHMTSNVLGVFLTYLPKYLPT